MDAPTTASPAEPIPADPREAILNEQLAAAVARGGDVQGWGRSRFEAVVAFHRYLPGRRWGYAVRLLVLGLFLTRGAVVELGLEGPGAVLMLGAIGLWVGRTRYERITVDEDGGVRVAGAGLLAAAAVVTLLTGLGGAIPGAFHLQGVLETAGRGVYQVYDFRLASLLILGFMMVVPGVLSLTAVRGLARGERRAWDRAMIGAILVVLAAAPITPLGNNGDMARSWCHQLR